MSNFELVEVELPAHYAMLLINNDGSDLSVDERFDILFSVRSHGVTAAQCIGVSDDTFHGRFNGYQTIMATFTFRRDFE